MIEGHCGFTACKPLPQPHPTPPSSHVTAGRATLPGVTRRFPVPCRPVSPALLVPLPAMTADCERDVTLIAQLWSSGVNSEYTASTQRVAAGAAAPHNVDKVELHATEESLPVILM